MNIQVFGINKCFDTKKSERYFKERKIPFQYIDLSKKNISKGELESVLKNVSLAEITNINSKEYKKSNISMIRNTQGKIDILLENYKLLKTPIVRNGKLATVGYKKEIWDSWE
ncbi:ArsC family protein [Clostridium bornimense]|uniref:ArsC family protein n=1 Tax=Clostridium bornimense TaxID=1216932 RepID=W6SG58_9CLOT|nr:ArsC/Spx/MgsR family protein [Clostridium bornimense]CDM68690.1 ArsC family protein [Clostridium bornimense]